MARKVAFSLTGEPRRPRKRTRRDPLGRFAPKPDKCESRVQGRCRPHFRAWVDGLLEWSGLSEAQALAGGLELLARRVGYGEQAPREGGA